MKSGKTQTSTKSMMAALISLIAKLVLVSFTSLPGKRMVRSVKNSAPIVPFELSIALCRCQRFGNSCILI